MAFRELYWKAISKETIYSCETMDDKVIKDEKVVLRNYSIGVKNEQRVSEAICEGKTNTKSGNVFVQNISFRAELGSLWLLVVPGAIIRQSCPQGLCSWSPPSPIRLCQRNDCHVTFS